MGLEPRPFGESAACPALGPDVCGRGVNLYGELNRPCVRGHAEKQALVARSVLAPGVEAPDAGRVHIEVGNALIPHGPIVENLG